MTTPKPPADTHFADEDSASDNLAGRLSTIQQMAIIEQRIEEARSGRVQANSIGVASFEEAAILAGETVAWIGRRVSSNDVAGKSNTRTVSLSSLMAYLETRKKK